MSLSAPFRFRALFCLAVIMTAIPPVMAVDFATEIQPIMREKCFKCHSGRKAKKGLRYDDTETLAKFIGDHEDAVIKPGKPEESRLIQLTSLPRDDSEAMPPRKRGVGLSLPELSLFKRWITEGAKLDGGKPATPVPPAGEPKLLTWTNLQGKTLLAYFVKLDGKNVVLRKDGGAEFDYPLSQLAADSRRLASEQAASP